MGTPTKLVRFNLDKRGVFFIASKPPAAFSLAKESWTTLLKAYYTFITGMLAVWLLCEIANWLFLTNFEWMCELKPSFQFAFSVMD